MVPAHDPFDLERFLDAQAHNYDDALAELRAGRKRSHWMWYVFPQFAGLGASPTSRRFAIRSRDEAVAYWAHPVLGPRLRECAEAMLVHEGLTAHDIMGSPDDVKLRSSATLFAEVTGDPVFSRLLDRYFEGCRDDATLRLLHDASGS